jgi:hypothetical protein
MAKFRFYQNVQVIATRREYYTIEADTLEEARQLAEGCANLEDCESAEYNSSELLLDDDGYNNGRIYGIYDEDGEEIE